MTDKTHTPLSVSATLPHKEAEPGRSVEIPLIVENTESSPEFKAQPHADYITEHPDSISIDETLKKVGATSSDEIIDPVKSKLVLPISDTEIVKGLHSPISSSFRWLAELCVYLLKTTHIKLKELG